MINELKILLLTIFSVGFIGDVFLVKQASDLWSDMRLLLLILFWLLLGKIFNFRAVTTMRLVFVVLILLSVIFLFFHDKPYTDRIVTWIYVYLIVAVIQEIYELKKQLNKEGKSHESNT